MPRPNEKRTPLHWHTLADAANRLTLSPDALRKQLERHIHTAPDGSDEAQLDGIRARKFAGRWRVTFGKGWTE